MRNSILTGNGAATAADPGGALASTYNDLFGNQTNYVGVTPGTGDLASAVTFADLAARDLHLTAPQPSTDRGDPTDAVGDEPIPNGGRINLGAFGGTADAELTAPSTAVGGPGTPGATPASDPTKVGTTPTSTPTPMADPTSGGGQDGGCRIAGQSRGGSTAGDVWAVMLFGVCAFLLTRRRSLK